MNVSGLVTRNACKFGMAYDKPVIFQNQRILAGPAALYRSVTFNLVEQEGDNPNTAVLAVSRKTSA